MNKQLLLGAMLMALVGANSCSAMVFRSRGLRLFVDNAAVKIVIPGFYGQTITGKVMNGDVQPVAVTNTIGVQFPGEDEQHNFDLNQLGLNGPLTITVITNDPGQNSVEFENGVTHSRSIFIEKK